MHRPVRWRLHDLGRWKCKADLHTTWQAKVLLRHTNGLSKFDKLLWIDASKSPQFTLPGSIYIRHLQTKWAYITTFNSAIQALPLPIGLYFILVCIMPPSLHLLGGFTLRRHHMKMPPHDAMFETSGILFQSKGNKQRRSGAFFVPDESSSDLDLFWQWAWEWTIERDGWSRVFRRHSHSVTKPPRPRPRPSLLRPARGRAKSFRIFSHCPLLLSAFVKKSDADHGVFELSYGQLKSNVMIQTLTCWGNS